MKILEAKGKYIGIVDESYKLHIVNEKIYLYSYVCPEVPEFPILILNIDKLKDVIMRFEGKHYKNMKEKGVV